jgi:hypothetical protein
MSRQIAFKEFARSKEMLGLVKGSVSNTVATANAWIKQTRATVLNVETIYDVNGSGGKTKSIESGIRVWYLMPTTTAPSPQ